MLPEHFRHSCVITNDSITSKFITTNQDMNEFEETIRQMRQFNTGMLCRNQVYKEFRFKVISNLHGQQQKEPYKEFSAFLGGGICLMFVFDASKSPSEQRVVYMHSLDTYEVHDLSPMQRLPSRTDNMLNKPRKAPRVC